MKKPSFIGCFFLLIALPVSCAGSAKTSSGSDKVMPKRIISLAPSVTETLFAVGAGDRVVGDTIYCNYPPEAVKLPKIGEFARFNFEKILELEPDMVIASKDSPSETIKYELDQYGIPLIVVGANTIEESIETVREIGRAVGADREAEEIASQMKQRLEQLRSRLKNAPKVKAVLVYGHEPLIIGGPETFADDIIRSAGGVNIAADARIRYPRYSFERLVLEGPEVIIEAGHGGGYKIALTEIQTFWSKWPSIPAVQNNRIAIVDADIVSRPGPRVIDGLAAVAHALHPELIPEKGGEF